MHITYYQSLWTVMLPPAVYPSELHKKLQGTAVAKILQRKYSVYLGTIRSGCSDKESKQNKTAMTKRIWKDLGR